MLTVRLLRHLNTTHTIRQPSPGVYDLTDFSKALASREIGSTIPFLYAPLFSVEPKDNTCKIQYHPPRVRQPARFPPKRAAREPYRRIAYKLAPHARPFAI